MSEPSETRVHTLHWSASLMALGAVALSGIAINTIILKGLGIAALGTFNQCYSVYVVAGQFAVLGIHASLSRSASIYRANRSETFIHLISAVLASLLFSVPVSAGLYFAREPVALFLNNPSLTGPLTAVAFSLPLFSCNKCLLSFLNGIEWMGFFAVGQSLRAFMILIGVAGLVYWPELLLDLPWALFLGEVIVFGYAAAASLWHTGFHRPAGVFEKLKFHVRFGSRASLAGILTDLTTRVDILVLSVFHQPAEVGLYSICSFFYEGFSQILVMLKNLFNPKLAQASISNSSKGTSALVTRYSAPTFFGMLAVLAVSLVAASIYMLYLSDALTDSWTVVWLVSILLAPVALLSGVLAFDGIMIQSGRPGEQSIYLAFLFFSNLVLNFLLVPSFGVWGASIGTCLAFLASGFYFQWRVRHLFGISIAGLALRSFRLYLGGWLPRG